MDDFKKHLADKMLPIGFMSIRKWTHPRARQALEEIDQLVDRHNLPTGYIDTDLENIKKHDKLDEDTQHTPSSLNFPSTVKTIKLDDLLLNGSHVDHGNYHRDYYNGLQQHFPSRADLSEEEAEAVHKYTRGSKGLNRSLVEAHHMGTSLKSDHQEHHDLLTSVAAKSKTPHDMVLYSGVGRANPGRHPRMLLPAYSSMTVDPMTAVGFARSDQSLPTHESRRLLRVIHQDGSHHVNLMSSEDSHIWHHYRGDDNWTPKSPEAEEHLTNIAKKYGHQHDTFKEGEAYHDYMHIKGARSEEVSHVLKIHVPKGSNVIYPGRMSNYEHEREIIAPAKSVISLRHHDPLHIDEHGRAYWHVDLETPKLTVPRKKIKIMGFRI